MVGPTERGQKSSRGSGTVHLDPRRCPVATASFLKRFRRKPGRKTRLRPGPSPDPSPNPKGRPAGRPRTKFPERGPRIARRAPPIPDRRAPLRRTPRPGAPQRARPRSGRPRPLPTHFRFPTRRPLRPVHIRYAARRGSLNRRARPTGNPFAPGTDRSGRPPISPSVGVARPRRSPDAARPPLPSVPGVLASRDLKPEVLGRLLRLWHGNERVVLPDLPNDLGSMIS